MPIKLCQPSLSIALNRLNPCLYFKLLYCISHRYRLLIIFGCFSAIQYQFVLTRTNQASRQCDCPCIAIANTPLFEFYSLYFCFQWLLYIPNLLLLILGVACNACQCWRLRIERRMYPPHGSCFRRLRRYCRLTPAARCRSQCHIQYRWVCNYKNLVL